MPRVLQIAGLGQRIRRGPQTNCAVLPQIHIRTPCATKGIQLTYLRAFVQGIILGAAELLPVSRSGHQAILWNFFGLTDTRDQPLLDSFLHLGVILAVFLAYWPEIKALLRTFFSAFETGKTARSADRSRRRFLFLLFLATLPLFLTLFLKGRMEYYENNTFFTGFAMIAAGAFLFAAGHARRGRKNAKNAAAADALVVGLCQGIAIIPGLSRSGAAIAAGLLCQFDPEFSLCFSCLLTIPAAFGAAILALARAVQTGMEIAQLPAQLLAMAAAATSGYVSICLMKRLSGGSGFSGFAFYCWGAGLVTLALSLVA